MESVTLKMNSDNEINTLYIFLRSTNCILIVAHVLILWILTANTIKYLK